MLSMVRLQATLALMKSTELLKGLTGKKEGKTRLMNMVMQVSKFVGAICATSLIYPQLRKVTCHPYLFDGAVSI